MEHRIDPSKLLPRVKHQLQVIADSDFKLACRDAHP
jgi:hypothetical protein